MRTRSRTNRGGFTLLEVILASAIGLLILYGLYSAIEVNLRFADSGRMVVEQATLARSLSAKIAADVTPCVGMPDPNRYKQKSGSTMTTQPATGGTTPATGGTTPATDTDPAAIGTLRAFVGDESVLQVFVSRVPRFQGGTPGMMGTMTTGSAASDQASTAESDQKLVYYWLAGGTSSPLGLARYETFLSTGSSDLVQELPIGGSDEAKYVIAPEVKSLRFSYYDGVSWSVNWDGSQPAQETAPDGSTNLTPQGPPLAIAIELTLETPGTQGSDPVRKKYRHVVAIPTAAGKPLTSSDDTFGSEMP